MTLLDDLLEKIEGMSEEAKAELVKKTLDDTKNMVWVPNPGPQTEAYLCDADELYYGGEVGGGKATDINELALTPNGFVKIGSLKVGSKVCAVDGKITEVMGVFPQGVKANYRVHFHDGSSCLATLDHNWLGWWSGMHRKIPNGFICGETAAQKYTTGEIIAGIERFRKTKKKARFSIPTCQPVRFNVPGCPRRGPDGGFYVKRLVAPYLLGLLLGDGCLTDPRSVNLASADQEIEDYLLETFGNDISIDKRDGPCKSYRFIGEERLFLVEQLGPSHLGLAGHGAESKFIPHIYLFGTIEERWDLLQGLMDSDGWAEEYGDCYYCSISKQLIEDVTHLARSLGAVVTQREKIPTYTHKGDNLTGQKAYTIRIKVRDAGMLFRLSRKIERCENKEPQSMARFVEKIEYSHDAESVCIMVRHPSSLYITRDFIVTHNSDLVIGLALTAHKRSLIMRRLNDDARSLSERMVEILGHDKGLNRTLLKWPMANDRIVDFGGCQNETDKHRYKGVPHDIIAFDEGADFSFTQFEFIKIWNRSPDPNQRCRIVVASNPPLTSEGLWLNLRWAAWLDPKHPNPAKSGEIRYYVIPDDGSDREVEVDGYGPHEVTRKGKKKKIRAISRTFIRSELSDNPDYARTDYGDRLESLSGDLRDNYATGSFAVGMQDAPNQVIPTQWVLEAQKRWEPRPPFNTPMNSMGVDCSGGGKDPMVIARRYDWWFDEMLEIPGRDLPLEQMGKVSVGIIVAHRRDSALVVLDMGGGYGGAIYENLSDNEIEVMSYKGAEASNRRTADRQLGFFNKRSECIWKFREALDPDQEGGSPIALPPSQTLLADLTSPTFSTPAKGIKVENKEDIVKRLGRSTNDGDAVIMCWAGGPSILMGGRPQSRKQKVTVTTKRAMRSMNRRRRR